MDVPLETLISTIGHDGSAVVFPELPVPMRYAGFDMQEIVDAALANGWSMTHVEARPRVTPDGSHVRDLFPEDKIQPRMMRYFDNYSGIAIGMRTSGQWWHSVAWDHIHRLWFDPSGPVLPFNMCPIHVASFWIFQRVQDECCGKCIKEPV
jgi:hypothetical protein